MKKQNIFTESPLCVFCDILNGKINSARIVENERLIVINDRAPQAPIHCLIIPKKHINNLKAISGDDREIVCDIIMMSKYLAHDFFNDVDFKIMINNGPDAGQQVFHLHMHFLAYSTV